MFGQGFDSPQLHGKSLKISDLFFILPDLTLVLSLNHYRKLNGYR
jgi:hypothetical protein